MGPRVQNQAQEDGFSCAFGPHPAGEGKGCFIMFNGILVEESSGHGVLAVNWVHNKVNKALMVFAINCN